MSQDAPKNFSVKSDDGVTVILAVCPQIVPEVKEDLYAVAQGLADAPEPRRAVLDLSNIRLISSSAIGILINFQKRVKDAKGTLKICCLDPNVAEVFRLTKMDQVLDIARDVPDALDAFHGKARTQSRGEAGSWFSRMFGAK